MAQPRTLSANRHLRTALLCLLYFCQGFPWGFATIALLASLSAAGHPKAETATVVALAILPWTFKFFWAPLIDAVRLPTFGVRRPWIALAQFCMAATLLGAISSGALQDSSTLTYLAWVFFVHNCFASLQDVATDALAVDLLDDAERGRVNGMMWGSKLLGVAVGGAGMATVVSNYGMTTAVLVQAAGLLVVLLLVLAWRERPGERLFPWSRGTAQANIAQRQTGLITTFQELARALSTRTTLTLVVVAGGLSIAEGVYDPVTTEFFVQELGWGAERFARNQGTLGVLGELTGALLGGFLCDKVGQRTIAGLGMLLITATLLTFGLTSDSWADPDYPHVLLLPAFKGAMAFMTVSMFSLFMKVSWTTAAATQFTLYMAMSNLGYAFGAKLNSWIPLAGYAPDIAQFYIIASLFPLLPLVLLIGLNPNAVAARKRADDAATAAASVP